jgi:hypothetical protein
MEFTLDDRQRELIEAFVSAWEMTSQVPAHTPFDFDASDRFANPNWPPAIRTPSREEVRALVHLGLLEVDHRAAPVWRVFPSADARAMFDQAASSEAEALADPERRLELILEATVRAFNADPSEPLHFTPMDQIDIVAHPHWPLQPDSVHEHDLRQLEDLELISTSPRGDDLAFWPTSTARAALPDVASFIDRLADEAPNESEQSRLRRWVVRIHAGDFAVGTAAGTASGALIHALMGH